MNNPAFLVELNAGGMDGLARLILPVNLDVAIGGDFRFKPWRLLLLLNAGLNLIALCGLFIFPESPRYVLIQGRHDEALATLKKMFARNTGRPESEYPVERIDIDISGANLNGIHGVKDAIKTVWSQTTPLFYKERAPYTLILCFLLFFIFVIGQGTFMWFPTLLDQLVATKNQGYLFCESMYMMDSSINATITSDTCNGPVNPDMFYVLIFIGAAFTVLGLVFATFIDLVGKKSLLIISFCIIAVSNLLIHWVSSFNVSVILITLIMSTGNCASIVSAIAIEFFPTNISAMGMCLIMMVGRFGSAVGSNIVGKAIMNGCDSLFYTFMGIVIVAACFVKVLPNEEVRTKKQTDSGGS